MIRFTPMLSGEVKRMVDNQLNNKKVGFGSGRVTNQIEATGESKALIDFLQFDFHGKRQVYYTSIYIELYAKPMKNCGQGSKRLWKNCRPVSPWIACSVSRRMLFVGKPSRPRPVPKGGQQPP